MRVRRLQTAFALILGLVPLAALAGRPLEPSDWYRFRALSDLQIAPDGGAVAYVVTRYDRASDQSIREVWLADWDGRHAAARTHGASAGEPRFSPDGRLSYLAAPSPDAPAQLWVLGPHGGKPRQLSHVSDEIASYAWAPDGRHVVLVMRAGEDAAKPLVIDAYHFKEDVEGYLTAESRTHLYLLDVASGVCQGLAADPARADSHPVFSPDGGQLAFIGNGSSRESAGRDEIYIMDARPGAQPRLLLSGWSPNNPWLAFSPDGRQLGFLQGEKLRYNAYIDDSLALTDAADGGVHELTARLDRGIYSPRFTSDGRAIVFAIEDDGRQYPAQVTLASGEIAPIASGPEVVKQIATAAGHTAVLASHDAQPIEVFALENGRLRPLSAHNRALFAELALGTLEDIAFKSRDGTEIHGQVLKPPGYESGRRYPTLLWIHGGPQGQDDHSLELEGYGPPLERLLFASHGYVVLAVNYRGGTGRGAAFAHAVVGDWGHLEVEDLLAGVDWAVREGIADPERLGVGGWSYGALLSDYLIASDTRFKAAISGAGSGDQVGLYGTDEYIIEDDNEIGPPWRNTELWLKISYPFFHADRIHTPTLFLGGDRDFDVPLAGGEQMYQALRSLGVPTQLVVYPGEYHTFTRPSFLADRWQRYLDWMAKYVR